MFKYLSVEYISTVGLTIFWAIFYAWTAVSLLASMYAIGERSIVGNATGDVTIRYTGPNGSKGLWTALAGIAGIVVGWVVLPLMMGGVGLLAPPSRLFSGASGAEAIGLVVLIVSVIVLNFGVWLCLTSEEWTSRGT